jgi:hypothetical protein
MAHLLQGKNQSACPSAHDNVVRFPGFCSTGIVGIIIMKSHIQEHANLTNFFNCSSNEFLTIKHKMVTGFKLIFKSRFQNQFIN